MRALAEPPRRTSDTVITLTPARSATSFILILSVLRTLANPRATCGFIVKVAAKRRPVRCFNDKLRPL
jgi:hypothetical protein